MVQNDRRFAVHLAIIISSALRPMEIGSEGLLMMQNSNSTIPHRSNDRKLFKMAAVLQFILKLLFVVLSDQ